MNKLLLFLIIGIVFVSGCSRQIECNQYYDGVIEGEGLTIAGGNCFDNRCDLNLNKNNLNYEDLSDIYYNFYSDCSHCNQFNTDITIYDTACVRWDENIKIMGFITVNLINKTDKELMAQTFDCTHKDWNNSDTNFCP